MSIISTQDSAVNTPVVPNAADVFEYRRYFWIRNPHADDGVNGDRVYTWNENAVSHGTFQKWEVLHMLPGIGEVTNEMLEGLITFDKLAGSIPMAKLNIANSITNQHIDAITPDVIDGLSGTNTGDQTLSVDGSTLTISGANGNSVTIPNASLQTLTWNSGTQQLSISGGNTVTLSSLSLAVQEPTITNNKYHTWYAPETPVDNTWTQVSFSGVADANQPYITFSAAGNYLVFGELGVSTHSEVTIEIGLVDVTDTAGATVPASKQHIARRTIRWTDGVPFQFHLTGIEANDKWRMVFRPMMWDVTNAAAQVDWASDEGWNLPGADVSGTRGGSQHYPLPQTYSLSSYNFFDSNRTWMKAVKIG